MADEIESAVSASVRRRIADAALAKLASEATAAEQDGAIVAIRAAMAHLGSNASEQELVRAAGLAVEKVSDNCRRRLRREHWSERAPTLLPLGADDDDRREAVKIAFRELRILPIDRPQAQVEEEIKACLKDLSEDIQRRNRITQLIARAHLHIYWFLHRLMTNAVITRKEIFDTGLRRQLEQAVEEGLQDELTGEETEQEAEQIAEEIVLDELEVENDGTEW